MTKMKKKIRTLLTLGVITATTASTLVPVNALSKDIVKKCTTKYAMYVYINDVYINGVAHKLPINIGCLGQPSKPNTTPDNNNSGSVEKPNTKPDNNNSGSTEKPNTKPDNNNSGSAEKPETKPDNNNSGSTEKPETKPDNNNSGSTTGNFSAFQKEVVDLVNLERSKKGLSPLKLDSEISNVATVKSQDMINKNYFDHNSPTYGSPFDMMKKFGISYKSAGENIAMGQKTSKEVVTAWMNSKGHRENILNSSFTHIGVGVAKDSNGSIYWTQMFVGR